MIFSYLFKCNTCLLIFFNCFAGFSQESQTRYYFPVNYCLETRHMVKVCNSTAVISKIHYALKFGFNFYKSKLQLSGGDMLAVSIIHFHIVIYRYCQLRTNIHASAHMNIQFLISVILNT